MRPPPPPNPDLDDLLARIREAAGKPGDTCTDGADMRCAGGEYPPPRDPVSCSGAFARRKTYRLREFLVVPEADFLTRAYRAILKREPHEADHSFYRTGLYANGNRPFVLASILWSEEAQRRRVRVRGLGWIALFRPVPGKRLLRPVLGALERLIRALDPSFDLAVELNELRRELETSRQGGRQGRLERRCEHLRRRVDEIDSQLCALESRIATGASVTEDPASPPQAVRSGVREPERVQREVTPPT